MKIYLASAALIAALSGVASAAPPPLTDAQFVKMAGVGNAFEMDEAKLALDQATDPRLKAFAQRMLTDHGEAMKKLDVAAKSVGQTPSMDLDAPHQAMLDNLKTFHAADFDKIYAADQIAAHAETAALLSDYQRNGKNETLRSWVGETLPVVKQHQAVIDALSLS